MNIPEEPLRMQNSIGCASKLFYPCMNFISYFNIGHPVHPSEPVAPADSEFFEINSNLRLRVIHVKPEKKTTKPEVSKQLDRSSHRGSLSEEYWFTRYNKPLRIGNCNCSFRRSYRLSKASVDAPVAQQSNYKMCISIKIVNVETFVERLIQETFFQAFQEYFVSSTKINNNASNNEGMDNLGFIQNSDDFNEVILRKKHSKQDIPAILPVNCVTTEGLQRYSFTGSKVCSHKNGSRTNEKPLIILLHGIGSTADVWGNIIDSLLNKGYEIVAPDMLGHGYSSVPNRASFYSFKSLVNNAVALFDYYIAKHTSQKCIIIAHSFGCSIATAVYRFRPHQVTQLVLISGGGPTPLASAVGPNEMSHISCTQFLLKPLLICGLKRRFFYSSRGKHFEACDTNNAIPNHVLECIADGQNWPEGDAAYHRRVLIPTLLVHGLQDTKVTLVQECEMERTIPRAFLELIPNAGHMAMLETPEHLSHMILCFIDWWNQ